MTAGPGIPPRPPASATMRPKSGVERWKLTEPARLYGYAILCALAVVLVAAGLVTGELAHALTGLAAAVLGLVPAVETIRASVFSPLGRLEQNYKDQRDAEWARVNIQ